MKIIFKKYCKENNFMIIFNHGKDKNFQKQKTILNRR